MPRNQSFIELGVISNFFLAKSVNNANLIRAKFFKGGGGGKPK